ncbi:MAG: T9SS type A sorting domain-containing protein [Chitinophagales bacterium]
MNKGILFFALLTLTAIAGIAYYQPLKEKLHEREEGELYGNDEEGEAAEYNFKRFRNPFTNELPKDIRKKELAFAATLPKNNDSRATNWQNRGPYNLGGRTRALALDVTNENTILAGQVSGGMWRSTDGGAHFSSCTQPQQLHSVSCVAQDKRSGKTNVWYYGTGEQYGVVNAAGFSSQFSGDGIFKSTDGGVSWSLLPSTTSNTPTTLYEQRDFDFVWEIVTDATNNSQDEVYAATVNGVWRSVDGGTSWTPVLGLDTSISQISEYTDLAITRTGVLYATISSETPSKGIWRSEDGITWTNITPSGFPASYARIEMGIAPGDENQVYFIAETSGSGSTGHNLWKYHYLSGNGSGAAGGKWENRTANIPDDHCTGFYTFDFRKYSSQTSYDMYIVVHPSDTNLVFLGGTNIFRSFDGFKTAAYDWIGGYQCDSAKLSNYVYPNHHPDQHRLVFIPSNTNNAISSNDGGIMKTMDITATPVTWQSLNNDYNTGQFYTCAIEPGNTNSEMIIGGLQDNGTFFTNTVDYTQPWPKVGIGDGAYCAITHNRTNYYLSWQTGKVFKYSINDDGTVNNLSRIDPTGGGNAYLFIAPFMLAPDDDNVMYLDAGRTLWRNDSLGAIPMTGNEYNPVAQGWTKLNGTSTGSGITSPHISCLDISEENTNILYFGTDDGSVYRLDSCRTNNNASKINITSASFPVGAYVSCVEVDRLNHNKVLVTFSNYGVKSIYYTTDAGANWTDVSGNLEEHPDGTGNGPSITWGHIYNDGTNTKYYIGSSIGLFSTDQLNGSNTVWVQEGANTIGNVVINMITSRTFDNTIVVATHGNGMYSNKVFTPSGIVKVDNDPIRMNVFPNPGFGDYTLEADSRLVGEKMEIYSFDGKLVSTELISTPKTELHLKGAAGIYFIKVKGISRRLIKL